MVYNEKEVRELLKYSELTEEDKRRRYKMLVELPIFLAGLLFYAFSRITTSGFYATEQSLFSYICVYAEPVLLLILLLIVPRILRQDGVWLSMVLSQILTAGIACLLRQKEKKRVV